MSHYRFFAFPASQQYFQAETLVAAKEAAGEKGFFWVDCHQPTREELISILEPLELHPLAIEDCTNENQIPKLEEYPGHSFFIFNDFQNRDGDPDIEEIDIFLGDRFLVTVCGFSSGTHCLEGIDRLIEQNQATLHRGPAYLLHQVLDLVVDRKFEAIERLEDSIEGAEERMLADPVSFHPADLLDLRRQLLLLRKSLFHEREILVKICRRDCPRIPEKAILHFRDIYDHLARLFELVDTARDTVNSLMEIYLSMLNNRMAKVANKTNLTMRRLTLITTVFMPLTLLAGVGGMSEWSMVMGVENWRWSYPLFLAIMLVIAAANYLALVWLEKKDRGQDLD